MIQLEYISKSFSRKKALENISLEVPKSKINILLGPSGCGKSTLLRIIISLLEADAGKGYNFLRSRGPGLSPVWEDIESLIQYMTGAANRVVALDLAVAAPMLTVTHVSRLGGGQGFALQLSISAPSLAQETKATVIKAVGGAVSHNEDVGDTDETSEANNAAANDMTLLPSDGAINDYYSLGDASKFDAICVNVGTPGADYTLAYEYSRGGGAWATLLVVHDSIGEWKNAGRGWLTFSRPADWATDTIAGITGMYWIRAKATSVGVGFVQPLGTQSWILVYP
jgi:energy-coupling factor transporter ATP-binding protein EcfA2